MALSPENVSMALFCDFENVALGVRDANYDKFDIKRVLERLLLKGSIVVKKAYCDWERYKGFKATMHEANFELIEIPHVRQSGKNSADIRLVVDALDLCYTKSHVNTFVIISGDSDFSPLVSKLRENAKYVIGVGVKQSTSDLLIANCDEFIFYDDLVRDSQREAARRDSRAGQQAPKRSPEDERLHRAEKEKRKQQAIELAVETFDALVAERGDSGKIWASVLKEAIKRRKPDFNESYYGFRAFGNLIEEAQARGLLEFGRDEKSGAYVFRSNSTTPGNDGYAERAAAIPETLAPTSIAQPEVAAPAPTSAGRGSRRQGRNSRAGGEKPAKAEHAPAPIAVLPNAPITPVSQAYQEAAPAPTPAVEPVPPNATTQGGRRQGRNGRAAAAKLAEKALSSTTANPPVAAVAPEAEVAATATVDSTATAPKKAPPRPRRPRKAKPADTDQDS